MQAHASTESVTPCCSTCGESMEQGWLAIYEPLPITRLIWQNKRPGWLRLLRPKGSEKVIQPLPGGRGCPVAYICRKCQMITFSYDQRRAS